LIRINPLWAKILSSQFLLEQVTYNTIANAVREAILTRFLPADSTIPPYRKIALYLEIDKGIVEKAWSHLMDVDKLIVTSPGRGATKVVSHIKFDKRRNFSNPRKVCFDQECVMQTDPSIKLLNNDLKKGYVKYEKLGSKERKNPIIYGLFKAISWVLNQSLAMNYRAGHVYYSQSYKHTLSDVCKAVSSVSKCLVICNPVGLGVKNAVEVAGFKIEIVENDRDGMRMDSLEKLCEEKKVGIVYLCSRRLYPEKQVMTEDKIHHLMDLQEQYKFVIFEDDEYAGLFSLAKPNLLLDIAEIYNHKIVYIRPLSLLHPDLAGFKIVASSPDTIVKIRGRITKSGEISSPVMGHSLLDVLRANTLLKYENKVQMAMQKKMGEARRILLQSQIWKQERVKNETGWYFYLEPITGQLPDNYFQQLTSANIGVMNPLEFDHGKENNNVVIISVAGYLSNNHLAEDLNTINRILKTMIK